MTEHDHHHGLSHDLPGLVERGLGRRGVLSILGGLGAVTVVGCATTDDGLSDVTNATTGEIPEETGGPYPGDGSNGPNALSQSGVVRTDITRSFGSASGVAAGVPLTIRLKVLDVNGDEATAYHGAAVYLWHCDREGNYSMYSEAAVDENYLRGVQEADATGALEFTSIFPAAYAGRWPHIHFEVYPTINDATSASNRLRTSQLALPEDVCLDVYENAEGYQQSLTNVQQTSLDSDLVFSDGYSLQMAKVTGSVEDGFVATLTIPV